MMNCELLYPPGVCALRNATLLDLLQLSGLVLSGKRAYRRVFDLWVAQPRLSFADCYHAALVERLQLPAIITFDQDFDRVAGITRREP